MDLNFDQQVDKVMRFINENINKWELKETQEYEGSQYTIWMKEEDHNSFPLAQCETFFRIESIYPDVDPHVAFMCFYDSKKRQNWDTRCSEYVTVEDFGDNEFVKYYRVKSIVPMVQDRDVLIK